MQTSIRAFVLVLSLAGIASSIGAKTIKGKTVGATTHIPTCTPATCGVD